MTLLLAIVLAAAQIGVSREADRRSPGFPAYANADKLFVAKRFPECLAALDESLRLDPRLLPALTLKAKLAMTVNRYDVARESLERALAIEPAFAYAQFLYGLEAYLTNNLQTALPRFERARSLDPADPRAAFYLGLTRESLGQPLEALELYKEAARLEKPAPRLETILTAARLLLLLDRFEESEIWIQRALKTAPKSRDAYFEWARLSMKRGEPEAAARAAEKALQLPGEATDAQIHYLLVRAYGAAGQPEKAQVHAAPLKMK